MAEGKAEKPPLRGRIFERWLERGWSPPKVSAWVLAAVTTTIPVVGYLLHPHSPGAAWWLVAALGIACFWGVTEVARWRIRHGRLHVAHGRLEEAHALHLRDLDEERKARATAVDALTKEQTAHAETKVALNAARTTPDPAHIARLRAVAEELSKQVVNDERPVRYTDGGPSGPTLRRIWRHHAAHVAQRLNEYDQAKPKADEALVALNARIDSEIETLDENAGWWRGGVKDALTTYTGSVVTNGGQEPSMRFDPRTMEPRPDGTAEQRTLWWVGSQSWTVWNSHIMLPDTSPPSTSALTSLVEAIRESEELHQAVLGQSAMNSSRTTAWHALDEILGRDGFPGTCDDLCRGETT